MGQKFDRLNNGLELINWIEILGFVWHATRWTPLYFNYFVGLA